MISYSWIWNLIGGLILALIATGAMMEVKSSSLIPKSLLLWPACLVLFGIFTFVEGCVLYGFSVTVLMGIVLAFCGVQAVLVNIRRLSPWPSGGVWLFLILMGLAFQIYPWYEQHVMGFIWVAVGLSKVLRERSANLELQGTPVWIQLLFLQAVLLASYR